jgi:hypothetical protein
MIGKYLRLWIVSQSKDGCFRANRNIVPGANDKMPAVEEAAKVNDIAFSDEHFPAVKEPAGHLDVRLLAKAAQICQQIRSPHKMKRHAGNKMIISASQDGPGGLAKIH